MRVPAVPPTNLAGSCRIISVQYKLDFHVDPSGWSFDLVVSLPITVSFQSREYFIHHHIFPNCLAPQVGTIPPAQYIPSLAPPPPSYLSSLAPSAPDLPYPPPEKGGFIQEPWTPSAPPDK